MSCYGCGPSIWGDKGSKYIKVGDGEFVAVDGADIVDRLGLSDLRIPYDQLFSTSITLKPGQENYLLNCMTDNVTFLAIVARYDSKALQEDRFILYKMLGCDCEMSMSQLLVLTGNTTHRISDIFLTNTTKYPVKLNVMMGIIDDNLDFFDSKPIVYFTDMVDKIGSQSTEPWNTTDGIDFIANLNFGTYSQFDKSDIVDLLIDDIRDSNGDMMDFNMDYFILNDLAGNTYSVITQDGTYSLTFDITDDYGNSLDGNTNVIIEID